MLLVGAPAPEIARLRAALRALARDDAEGFDALFAPAAPHLVVRGLAPALAAELRAFGLVSGDDDGLEGQHRIRRVRSESTGGGASGDDDRFYVLELGGTHHLFWLGAGALYNADLDTLSALVGAAAADGESPPLPERIIDRGARRLAALLL